LLELIVKPVNFLYADVKPINPVNTTKLPTNTVIKRLISVNRIEITVFFLKPNGSASNEYEYIPAHG